MSAATPKTLDFNQAIDLAMGLADFERSTHSPGHSGFHLERVGLLAERLGNVHRAVPAIHVAGTKGKGSTSALITSILSSAGYTVGLFTSPHLHTVCERVRIGLDPISREEFAALVAQIWPAVEDVGSNGPYGGVTFFEMMTVLAMVHFRNIGADFQVLEVGLGGRLDSTNIVTPEVSAITSISIDHAATLGDTIAKIATEKAGIIKPGTPCVIGPQWSQDAMRVFDCVADERGSPMVNVSEHFEMRGTSSDLNGQSIEVTGEGCEYDLWTPLLGDHQIENVATAVAAIEVLQDRGHDISYYSIVKGVRDVCWPARFQIYERNGKTITVDGAHNPYSVGRLLETIRQLMDSSRVLLVFGSLGGHSAEGMLEVFADMSPDVIAVQSRHPRSARASVTGERVRSMDLNLIGEFVTVADGLRYAIEAAEPDDLILCSGSIALAAEAIEELEGIEPEIYENLRGPVHRPLVDN
ncbi:MAG: bifunctional folylpolyglutamate synthase/dihydrofolate synthase [Dehalococcoidia bacterium]|nr:bifunctional folylpolyglutamate synthase/dihydrofolate synthase [Dehalococcoidia bacterium]